LLAGMVARLGILDISQAVSETELRKRVKAAYLVFRDAFEHPVIAQHFRTDYSLDIYPVPIRFVGIWDTVDAVGVPVDELRLAFDNILSNSFPDNVLNDTVQQAAHALAIDDQRRTFLPVMWDQRIEENKERIQQYWFAGVHSNVGGGYPKPQMAYVALGWIMKHAIDAGLQVPKSALDRITGLRDVHGQIYDSRVGGASYYRLKPRDMEAIRQDYTEDELKLHYSVLLRIKDASDGYSPFNLTVNSLSPDADVDLDNPSWKEAMQRAWGLATMRRLFNFAQLLLTAAIIISAVGAFASTEGLGIWDAFEKTKWVDLMLDNLLPTYVYGAMALIIYFTQRRLKLCIRDIASSGWAFIYPEKRAGPTDNPCDPERAADELCEPCQAIVQLGMAIRESDAMEKAGFFLEQIVVRGLAVLFYPLLRLGRSLHKSRVMSAVDMELKETAIPMAQGELRSVIFQTSVFCLNTGIGIEAGQKYHLKVDKWSSWKDWHFPANPDGLINGEDEQELSPWKKLMRRPDSKTFCLLAEIDGSVIEVGEELNFTAEFSGELKLYVNDVDLRLFQFRDMLYRNNKGIAKINIERL
jgi:hypothetical protein